MSYTTKMKYITVISEKTPVQTYKLQTVKITKSLKLLYINLWNIEQFITHFTNSKLIRNCVTAKQIQEHLYNTYLDLKQDKLSLSTIRGMFNTRNKYFKAADRYKALVNARVGAKRISLRRALIICSKQDALRNRNFIQR